MTWRPRVAVSLGDPCGIGPEVTASALADPAVAEGLVPVVLGSEAIWRRAIEVAGVDPGLPRIARPDAGPGVLERSALSTEEAPWGGVTDASARAQLAWFLEGVSLLASGEVDALCTAPITKAAVVSVDPAFVGHTEVLAGRLAPEGAVMLLGGPRLKVALVTTHAPLAQVPSLVDAAAVLRAGLILHAGLRDWFGLQHPRLAVCGLNPHAGEGGRFGAEDLERIAPAVRRLQDAGVDAVGPLAADGAMAEAVRGTYDAVLAMYHDQGLTAVKALHFDDAVNVTLGLTRPRTSPDHGSALGLAGRGLARADSMKAALRLAAGIARRLREANA